MSQKALNPNYFYTKDHFRIFYSTNFLQQSFEKNKPLIIFNYGLVCNNEHWKHQIDFFNNKGFQILTHDYRFHYSSSGDESNIGSCTFDNISQDIYELLNFLGAKKTYMFGHSMGVNITLEFARLFPENILGMILISGSVLPPQEVMFDSSIVNTITPFVENLYQKHPDLYKSFWSKNYLNPIARQIIYRGGFNTKKVPEEFIEIYMKRIGELPPQIFLKLMREMQGHNILKHLNEIKTPSLIIGGDNDKVIPNYLQNIFIQELPSSEMYIVKDGSHVPQWDFPNSVNERSLSFINKQERSAD